MPTSCGVATSGSCPERSSGIVAPSAAPSRPRTPRRPAAVSAFPGEGYQAPRTWTERAYHNLIYYNQPARGGHFAAWEQPQIFSEEVRAGLRSLRK
jgi:hypothetical protein